jgi:hypothetical protein
MPITATCPYCRAGGVRAPDHAAGLSANCPKCKSSFTIIPDAGLPGWSKGDPPPAPPPPPARPPVEETGPHATAEDVTEPSPVLTADPPRPRPRRVSASAAAPPVQKPAPPGLVVSLVAVTVFGLAMLASQFPFGRFIAPSLAGIGLLVGLLGLTGSGRARIVAAVGAGLNLVAVAVVFLAPSWLGLEPWRTPTPEGPKTPQAVAHGGSRATAPADWVDAMTASWAEGDVRITVRSAAVAPIELVGPGGTKKTTKELYLQILVRLANEGVERRVELSGWAAGGEGAQLTDPAGKPFAPKRFEAGWEPVKPKRSDVGSELAVSAKPTGLFPGRWVDVLLVFEAPSGLNPKSTDGRPEFFRLELSGPAVGVPDPARFRIPGAFVIYGRTP